MNYIRCQHGQPRGTIEQGPTQEGGLSPNRPARLRSLRHGRVPLCSLLRLAALALLLPTLAGCQGSDQKNIEPPVSAETGANGDIGAPVAAPVKTPTAAAPVRSLLLISVDTLRADHIGAFGGKPDLTPALDELAERSIVFENVQAPAPFTMPSVAALMTGLWPERTGADHHSRKHRLDRDIGPTLASLLEAEGLVTVAIVTNPWLSRADGGFDRGFRDFVTVDDQGRGGRDFRAASVTDTTISTLEKLGEKPFLLWVHYLDPHMPYEPDQATDGSEVPASIIVEDFTARPMERTSIWFGRKGYSEDELTVARERYAAEVAGTDRELGRLLAAVAAGPQADRTMIVFVADHGESLGEHGLYFSHDFTLFQELLHVPVMIALPRVPGGRDPRSASLTDILPTICEAMSIACPAKLDGQSLLAERRGSGSVDRPVRGSGHGKDADRADTDRKEDRDDQLDGNRPVFSAGVLRRGRYARAPWPELGGEEGRWRAVRRGPWKLIRRPTSVGIEWDLFHLDADPKELAPMRPFPVGTGAGSIQESGSETGVRQPDRTGQPDREHQRVNLSPQERIVAEELRKLLESWMSEMNATRGNPKGSPMDEETRRSLKELGYL